MSDWENDEWRSALRADRTRPGDCYQCQYGLNRSGGGTCATCGATVGAGEL